jgi:hypothetical protein
MRADLLNVVAVYSNPRRFNSRLRLAKEFILRMLDLGITLTFVEHAFGERPFEFTDFNRNVNLVQVRGGANQEIWLKEALAKLGFQRIKDTQWKYAALIDADTGFQRHDIAIETLHMLQHHPVGQLFTNSIDLGPSGEVVANEWGNAVDRSFSAAWVEGQVLDEKGNYGGHTGRALLKNSETFDCRQHYGYAWGWRREAYDGTGGLIDWLVTGAADYNMAMGFAGMLKGDPNLSAGYNRRLGEFAARCDRVIKQDIGVVPGLLTHFWHGKKKNRFYISRADILTESKFDPDVDLAWDSQGLPFLCSDNRVLRDGLRRYNMARQEDSVDIE